MTWFKKTKYRSQPTMVDNIKFPSKKEASRYCLLKIQLDGGHISELILQPKFLLQEGFTKRSKKWRALYYIADFQYKDHDGIIVVEDVKGYQTLEFKIKHKLFEYKYPGLSLALI